MSDIDLNEEQEQKHNNWNSDKNFLLRIDLRDFLFKEIFE